MRGELRSEEFYLQICELYSVPVTDIKKIMPEIKETFVKGIGDNFPATIEAINALKKKGIVNCILSNALPEPAEARNFQYLIEAEYIFCSFDLGLLKPDVKIYEAVRQKLGCKFEEMIFIDDKIENVKAAQSLGIKSFVYDENNIQKQLDKIIG